MNKKPHKTRTAVAVGLLTLVLLAGAAWHFSRPLIVRALPSSASGVHWVDQDMFPDGSFVMAAELSEPECRGYVTQAFPTLEVLERSTLEASLGDEAMWALQWNTRGLLEPREWWNPGPVDDNPTWYANRGAAWELVQCRDGHVYYESFSH